MYAWYECGYAGAPDESTWEAIADAQGRFQLRGIPAGVYEVEARSNWHDLYDREIITTPSVACASWCATASD
jgi:hypothetical protein